MRVISVALFAAAAFAQTPDARPAFEAASVKLNTSGSSSSSQRGLRGQVVLVNNSMRALVQWAYNVKAYQVAGPEWLDNVRLDVSAKYPEGARDEDRPAMMRTLLEDRFNLVAHIETRDLPGYVLSVGKGGLKIKPVEKTEIDNNTNSNNGIVRVDVTSVPMKAVAELLARRVNSTVVDRTGADGVYSFKIQWQFDDSGGGPVDRGAAEFAAIQDAIATLGLHLQAQKVPVQVVVVDRVERAPVEN